MGLLVHFMLLRHFDDEKPRTMQQTVIGDRNPPRLAELSADQFTLVFISFSIEKKCVGVCVNSPWTSTCSTCSKLDFWLFKPPSTKTYVTGTCCSDEIVIYFCDLVSALSVVVYLQHAPWWVFGTLSLLRVAVMISSARTTLFSNRKLADLTDFVISWGLVRKKVLKTKITWLLNISNVSLTSLLLVILVSDPDDVVKDVFTEYVY